MYILKDIKNKEEIIVNNYKIVSYPSNRTDAVIFNNIFKVIQPPVTVLPLEQYFELDSPPVKCKDWLRFGDADNIEVIELTEEQVRTYRLLYE